MKKLTIATILSLLLLFSLALPAVAADDAPGGYLGSFARDFESVTKKLVDLAEAIPADKFSWRPTDEVRSVSEVYVHVAGANFFFASQLGVDMPEDFSRDAEKTVTAKDDVIALLKKSIDHIHQAADAKAGANLDEEIDFFGSKRPLRDIFMVASGHAHEHLGQSIAYARSVGVVPPWSRPAGGDEGGGGE